MDATNVALRELGDALVGNWTTQSEHRLLPATAIDGRATFEWLDGENFLVWRETVEHPDFPGSSLTVIGGEDDIAMYYFDSRGVARFFKVAVDGRSWTFTKTSPTVDFHQRLTWTLGDDPGTFRALAEMSEDDGKTWQDDLWTTYRRA